LLKAWYPTHDEDLLTLLSSIPQRFRRRERNGDLVKTCPDFLELLGEALIQGGSGNWMWVRTWWQQTEVDAWSCRWWYTDEEEEEEEEGRDACCIAMAIKWMAVKTQIPLENTKSLYAFKECEEK
jgi:hypothetical protein